MKFIDLTGNKYFRLKVLERAPNTEKGNTRWKSVCECGNEVITSSNDLTSGNTKSCGCYKREVTVLKNSSHGMSNSNEYKSWQAMINRCYNPKYESFKDYGGRGITVCDDWRHSFENFYKDVGKRPHIKYSLDRIDNNGNYEKVNCKWSTPTQQMRNQRIRKKNTSGFTGVACIRNKYRAFISVGLKKIHLGYYDDINQALEARRQGEMNYRL